MNERLLKIASLTLLVLGTFISYSSLFFDSYDVVLVFSFLLGAVGLYGLFHLAKPNSK